MKVGAQLYTVREFTKTRSDFIQTVDRIAAMGYDGVQLSAVGCMNGPDPELTVEDAAEILSSRSLECPATHRPWEFLVENTEAEIAFHQALDCSYTAIGAPPEFARGRGAEGMRELMAQAKPLVDRLAKAGIDFGYHNHAMEFERHPSGTMWEVLVNEATWWPVEMDTYWIYMGGADIVRQIERLSGRLPVVHVKDLGIYGWDVTYAPVGEGNLPWPSILSAFKVAGTEWLLVEQDECRRDPFESLESSLGFLRSALSGWQEA